MPCFSKNLKSLFKRLKRILSLCNVSSNNNINEVKTNWFQSLGTHTFNCNVQWIDFSRKKKKNVKLQKIFAKWDMSIGNRMLCVEMKKFLALERVELITAYEKTTYSFSLLNIVKKWSKVMSSIIVRKRQN